MGQIPAVSCTLVEASGPSCCRRVQLVQIAEVWCNLGQFGVLRSTLVHFDPIWRRLAQVGPPSCNLVQFGALRCTFRQLGAFWCTLVQVGEIWSRLVQIGVFR